MLTQDEAYSLYEDIKSLRDLYKETYADLSMLLLLSIEPEEYASMIATERNRDGAEPGAESVERVAAVVYALHGAERRLKPSEQNTYADKVNDYLEWIASTGVRHCYASDYHNFEAIGALIQYLRVCHQRIQVCDAYCGKALAEIREQFEQFAERQEFASAEFYQTLENHREKLLNRGIMLLGGSELPVS